MDNKKMYKRISTCFWFLLATMMFWLPIIITIFTFFIHSENNIELQEVSLNGIFNYGNNILTETIGALFTGDRLENMPLPFIYDMFYSLFDTLSFDMSFSFNYWSCVALSWFTTVYFFELICDFMVWLPRFFHNILNKGVDKID